MRDAIGGDVGRLFNEAIAKANAEARISSLGLDPRASREDDDEIR